MSDNERMSQGPSIRGGNPLRLMAVLLAAILLIVVAIAGIEIGRSKNSSPSTISVNGTGTVKGTPDTATFDIGVHTSNASAKGAFAENKQKMAALIAALEKNGVAKKELQTSGLNVYQNTNNNGVVTGYSVDNTLNVTMHRVANAGAAIDAAANAVGNGIQLNGISFSISNQSKLLQEARTKAMDNAKLAADQLASAGGTHVVALVKVSDQESQIQPIFYGAAGFATTAKASTPIETGTQSVTVQVSVVYSLAN